MKAKKLIYSILFITTLVSCSQIKTNKDKERLSIYTSFYPIYEFTSRIVKEKANVINITPLGHEPHGYQLTTKDIAKLHSDADLILLNGLGLEHWKDSLPETLNKKSFIVTDDIVKLEINGVIDPHVWLNPLNAIKEMEFITKKVSELDPKNKDYYLQNYNLEKANFEKLDKEIEEKTKKFKNKNIVVSHAALGYFCNRYNLNQIYVDGLSPEDEPTPKAIENVINVIKKYNINTIFYEELVSDSIAKSIAKQTGAKCELFNPLGALDNKGNPKINYLYIMRENLDKFCKACGAIDD